MAEPLNTPKLPPSSHGSIPRFTTPWILWLLVAAAMIPLGMALPRWWPTFFTALHRPPQTEPTETMPASEVTHSSGSFHIDMAIAGVITIWLVVAGIIIWWKNSTAPRMAQREKDRYRLAQLVLPCGCWLQLIHLGDRRLLVGHDRTGIRVLLELPPFLRESNTRHVSGDPERVSSHSEADETNPRTASILALFQKLKAATQASS